MAERAENKYNVILISTVDSEGIIRIGINTRVSMAYLLALMHQRPN